ncbi:glutamate receptor ionotropic, delta-2-like [Temnothorax longispinosus]|uniref:glutamate receptor ionotropic, delta-2-like n=1 Tax=Temnothorax longispinosus TaxID=300112 RepID=UPI003A99953F
MTYATARSIIILFLVLGTKTLTESIGINNYFQLINDVYRYYRTSCVIFVQSDNYDLNATTLVHTWSREFSRHRVMTVTTTFSDLTSEYNDYWKNITRPLFVVLLDTEETMGEFAETTRSVKPISFPIWLVMFLQRPGNPLEERCRHPIDNVFNVDFRTQMLVLCYARPILVEWYAIRDNRIRTFDLALWSPDRGLLLKTQKSLYARRSNMFGDVVRVASVINSPLISHENGTVGGFFGLLLIELSKVMNFTVEILDPVEEFGSWSKEKMVWTGAIGQLVTNEADIGISAFSMTTGRQNVIDYTIPLIRSRYRLYFKRPNTVLVEWSLYLRAFSFGTWIALLMIIITASILLTIIKTKGYFSMDLMFENYINVWGIYCQQGLSVILATYSASFISNLVLCTPKLPFSTLEGYVKDGSYKLIVVRNSAEYDVPTVSSPLLIKRRNYILAKQ